MSKSPSIALCTSLLATACLFAYSSDGGGYQDVMLIVPVWPDVTAMWNRWLQSKMIVCQQTADKKQMS